MNFKIDLKNIDLKNISLEDIQAKLKNVEKKTWIKIGVSVGAVVFFLVIFYGVLNPIVNKKKAQLDDMNKKKQETAEFVSNIKSAKKKIEKIIKNKMRFWMDFEGLLGWAQIGLKSIKNVMKNQMDFVINFLTDVRV